MELLFNEHSALAQTNLRALILDPEVWKLLTPEQVAQVQKYWPGDSYNGDLSALASNDHLRHDIAEYQKALAAGQHDPEWLRQAKAANNLRNVLAADVGTNPAAEKSEDDHVGHDAEQPNMEAATIDSAKSDVAAAAEGAGSDGADKEVDA
ncbi:hypothetical protein BKA67DRAFT_232784 [Truncatella angustata]|uniref:ASX DEUBAD domain-containing protein n=1 Tax=Truncatella angustata TaxID=152316 RepID=A0A9P8ZYR1_9PEZI|nr:uncharacterized protein BKA67DRAFT_232784 [Truncatella angustata]KAH6655298.1 hypothetical protein BKA67DRAFT_232784 [Truncatella angustata]KAH8205181.1 hypothetical protein TruAng_000593 [Truncatella angustata]